MRHELKIADTNYTWENEDDMFRQIFRGSDSYLTANNGKILFECEFLKPHLNEVYPEMKRFESFDAFLSERIKNSICEDNLGDIFSYL